MIPIFRDLSGRVDRLNYQSNLIVEIDAILKYTKPGLPICSVMVNTLLLNLF